MTRKRLAMLGSHGQRLTDRGFLLAMYQQDKTVRSTLPIIGSLALIFPVWITIGWGFQIAGPAAIVFVAFGSSLFFVALWLARQSKVRGLFTGISIFGAILSVLVTFFSVESLVHFPYKTWVTKSVIVIMLLDLVIYFVLRRVWRKW